jgi:hypothetical protein
LTQPAKRGGTSSHSRRPSHQSERAIGHTTVNRYDRWYKSAAIAADQLIGPEISID